MQRILASKWWIRYILRIGVLEEAQPVSAASMDQRPPPSSGGGGRTASETGGGFRIQNLRDFTVQIRVPGEGTIVGTGVAVSMVRGW